MEPQPSTAYSIEPMKLSTLLDRSVRFTAMVFAKLFALYVVLAVLDAIAGYAQLGDDFKSVIYFPALLVRSLLGFYMYILVPFLVARLWQGAREMSVADANERMSWGLVGRVLWLSIHVTLCTLFFLLLFIIPGIIYMINRILAFYILIIEDCSVKEALLKSKRVMRHGRWYRSTSPLFRIAVIGIFTIVGTFTVALFFGFASIEAATGSMGEYAAATVVGFQSLFTSFVTVFSVVSYTGLYFDACARFEGADLLSELPERL